MNLRTLAVAAIAVVAIAGTATIAACGDSTAEDEGALTTNINLVLQGMQEHDQDRIRDFASDGLRDRSQDRDFEQLAACIPEGAYLDFEAREIKITGDTATVTVQHDVSLPDGSKTEVEKVWEFERQDDGTWALSALPECPFQ